MRFSQGIKDEHHFTEDAPDSAFTAYSRGFPLFLLTLPHTKGSLYVNLAGFLTLYLHKDSFYVSQGAWHNEWISYVLTS